MAPPFYSIVLSQVGQVGGIGLQIDFNRIVSKVFQKYELVKYEVFKKIKYCSYYRRLELICRIVNVVTRPYYDKILLDGIEASVKRLASASVAA